VKHPEFKLTTLPYRLHIYIGLDVMLLESNTILVIDSSEEFCLEIKKLLLLEKKYDIISAFSATEGEKKIKRNEPDLVLLDIGLPGIDKILSAADKTRNTNIVFLVQKQNKKILCNSTFNPLDLIFKPLDKKTFPVKISYILETIKNNNKVRVMNMEFDYVKKVIKEKDKLLKNHSERMENLSYFLYSLNTNKFETVTDTISEQLPTIFPIDYFSLFICSLESNMLNLLLHNNNGKKPIVEPVTEYRIMAEVINTGTRVFISPFSNVDIYKLSKSLKGKYIASFPLVFDDRIIGILNFTGDINNFMHGADTTFVSIACEGMASALNNVLQLDKNRYGLMQENKLYSSANQSYS